MSIKKIALVTLLAASSFAAQADITILDGKLFAAETGHVTAEFLGSDAAYTNILIFDPQGQSRAVFNGHATPVGTVVDLGVFNAGTELKFQLHVTNTGDRFNTGPASANNDNEIHASAVLDSNRRAVVGFEDLRGGGDRDYNDLQFRVTNVSNISAVPEPSTWGMMLGGMGLLAFMARRRQKATRISL